ncbi:hypothetical protein LUZ63_000912 [Rhynchospora breviuscula]|uniref:Cytochrome P450 n=1 Tax=Rhynchospora breviuscula TaxID=2022672 RepID=A0A9Q0CWB4_9POAL|nr:hypothetical protein LUZ63_000912 [Rhynchospora breviuscula]
MAKYGVPNSSTSHLIFLATICLLPILLLFVFRKRTKSKQSSARLLPPGPKPWPFINNIHQLIFKKKPFYQWIHHFMEEKKTHIACVRFGDVHVIPIVSPNIALEVVRKNDVTFASRPTSFAAHMFSKGYKSAALTPSGDQWKKMRKILTSEIVCPKRHRFFHEKRAEEANHILHYVFNKAKRFEQVDIRVVARHYCGNVIRKLVFNKRYFSKPVHDGGPGADEIEHVNAMFTSLEYLYAFSISDYYPQLIGLNLDGHETFIIAACETFKKFHDPIVDERVELWRENQEREPEDFLDILIMLRDQEGRPLLTPDEIKAQSIEIMIAAVDNPSNAVEWILAEMMKNPDILQKAVNEIDYVVGKDRLVQEADIPRLNYLKACIREAFRLHPMDPFNVPHVAMEDTKLAGYFIPKGSHVLLSRVGLGRNPDIWHEPLEFKPERHLDVGRSDVVLAEPDMRFISFSTGRRGCIALNLGTAMAVMLLARLLQGFSWSMPHGLSTIDLVESYKNLKLAKPLVLQAEPRLPLCMYTPEKCLEAAV